MYGSTVRVKGYVGRKPAAELTLCRPYSLQALLPAGRDGLSTGKIVFKYL